VALVGVTLAGEGEAGGAVPGDGDAQVETLV
jgi:hypothetical protein